MMSPEPKTQHPKPTAPLPDVIWTDHAAKRCVERKLDGAALMAFALTLYQRGLLTDRPGKFSSGGSRIAAKLDHDRAGRRVIIILTVMVRQHSRRAHRERNRRKTRKKWRTREDRQ